jgi:hypothetical protein
MLLSSITGGYWLLPTKVTSETIFLSPSMTPDYSKEYSRWVKDVAMKHCKKQLKEVERNQILRTPTEKLDGLPPLQRFYFYCERYLLHYDLCKMGQRTGDKLDRKDKAKSKILDCWNKEVTGYNETIVARWPDGPQADADKADKGDSTIGAFLSVSIILDQCDAILTMTDSSSIFSHDVVLHDRSVSLAQAAARGMTLSCYCRPELPKQSKR